MKMENLTGVYASPYYQTDGMICLCVSFMNGTHEVFIHIAGRGDPIPPGPQIAISGFEPRMVIAPCTAYCRTSTINNLQQMRPVPEDLLKQILELPHLHRVLIQASTPK